MTLVGHSTGALLNTWLALERPDQVAALVVFAPAFRLNVALKQALSVPTEIPRWWPMPRRPITLHAAREVRELGREFRAWLTDRTGQPGFAGARSILAPVPVWMGNSGHDTIIDLPTAAAFYHAIDDVPAPRGRLTLPRRDLIPHDHLASPGDTKGRRRDRFELMARALESFLNHQP